MLVELLSAVLLALGVFGDDPRPCYSPEQWEGKRIVVGTQLLCNSTRQRACHARANAIYC